MIGVDRNPSSASYMYSGKPKTESPQCCHNCSQLKKSLLLLCLTGDPGSIAPDPGGLVIVLSALYLLRQTMSTCGCLSLTTDSPGLPVTMELLTMSTGCMSWKLIIMNIFFFFKSVLLCLQCLDWALVWKFISVFVNIVLERFEEAVKLDIMPTETSAYRE